jgi:hypothetical protein
MKAQRGSRGIALVGGGWLTSRPGRFIAGKETLYRMGRWVGPRSSLDGFGKSCLPSGFDPRTVLPVASRYAV